MPMFNDRKLTSYYGEKQPLFSPSNPPTKNAQPGKAEHCTLCSHRLAKGKEPACVEICPAKALTLVDFDAPTEKQKKLLSKAVQLKAGVDTKPKVRYICSNMDFREVALK